MTTTYSSFNTTYSTYKTNNKRKLDATASTSEPKRKRKTYGSAPCATGKCTPMKKKYTTDRDESSERKSDVKFNPTTYALQYNNIRGKKTDAIYLYT